MLKISLTGNGPEIEFLVNLSDICMILRIILEYKIQYCMSYVHDISQRCGKLEKIIRIPSLRLLRARSENGNELLQYEN